MLRFVAVLAVLVLLWMGVRSVVRSVLKSPEGRQLAALWRLLRGGGTPASPESPSRAAPRSGEAQTRLVPCAWCRTHIPESRALPGSRPGEVYCKEACREAAAA